jgi:hypothetical protein
MEQRKSAVAIHAKDSMLCETRLMAELRKVENARNGVQFFDANGDAYANLFARCCVLIGCIAPTPEAAIVLANFLRDHKPLVFDTELLLAVELNVAGKYSARTEHYNSFDASYVGQILDKYTEYKRELALKEARQPRIEDESRLLAAPTSDEGFEKIIQADIENLKAGKNMIAAKTLAPFVVDYLASKGRLEYLTDDVLIKWQVDAKETIFRDNPDKWTRGKVQRLKNENHPMYKEFQRAVLMERKRIIYFNFLKEQIK